MAASVRFLEHIPGRLPGQGEATPSVRSDGTALRGEVVDIPDTAVLYWPGSDTGTWMPSPLQLSIVSFAKGTYIIVEGKAQADVFYIIRTGKVKITKAVEIVQEDNVMGPGDFFGVISSMSGHSHIETAQALTDVSLISVHKDQFDLLIEKNAPVAIKIIQGFARKMRYLDSAYTKLTLKNTGKEDTSHLFNVGEHYARQNQYNLAYYAYYKFTKYCPTDPNVATAKERLAKIQPYAKAVYLEGAESQFTRQYPKNTMIFCEAEPGNELFIIQRGRVRISKIVEQNEILIAVLKANDIFGEMALLTNDPRSASAIAHDDATLMVVNRSNFEKMVHSQPQLITKLTVILANRIWLVYKQIANATMGDPLGRLYDMLAIELEKNRVTVGPSQTYTFEVGPKELLTMVGLPAKEGTVLVNKLLENKKLKLADNRIFTASTEEVVKQVEYFRKMEQIKRSRQAGSLSKG
jgi:CRP-like cAMP-binding protein